MTDNKTIGLYARCSTKKQDLDSQTKALKEYADKQDYYYEVYSDFAVSGKKDNRKGINDLLDKARKKEIDYIGVVELSRIGRSIGFIWKVVEELSKLDIKIILVNSGTVLDYKTLEGRALINALAMASDIEWCLIQERNARGRAKIKDEGIKVGRHNKEISLEAVKLMHNKGMSLRQIGKELNSSPATIMRILKRLEIGQLSNVSKSTQEINNQIKID
jgi:DNA invertase Pin-like site-specific DNA recombinase